MFGLALIFVLAAELATPDDVVGAVALLPVTAAMWSLSSRYAALIALLALGCFVLIFIREAGNRPTVIYVGATGLVMTVAVRWYATRLVREPIAPSSPAWTGFRIPTTGLFEDLTRREVEVARLAAGGWSAPEIGQQLHISERTVESHLANAYAKLGIHSRSALRQLGVTLHDQ